MPVSTSYFIRELGLKDAKLHINSIGCKNCRRTYNEALLSYLRAHEDCHNARINLIRNTKFRKQPLQLSKMFFTFPIQVINCARGILHHLFALWHLTVKDAQRVLCHPLAAGFARTCSSAP